MFIFPPSGLGCDLEFEFSSFELENPLICVYNKNFRPSGDCQAARWLSDCCGRSKQRLQARGAPSRSSIYTFSARAPSRRAVFSRFPRSAPYTCFNSQSGGVCTVRRRCRKTAAVRRAQKSTSLFSGALAISLFISGNTLLSVFFQCHRTTISKTFYSVLNYLTLSCKNLVLITISMSDCLFRFHHA